MKKKTVKEAKIHIFLVCACKSQDFAQSQKIFVRSHNRETVTFINFGQTYALRENLVPYQPACFLARIKQSR